MTQKKSITVAEFRQQYGHAQTQGKTGKTKGNATKKSRYLGDMKMVLLLADIKFETEYRFDLTRKYRFDIAIPDKKIGIEYEGLMSAKSRHTTNKGYTGDCDKYNLAQAQGWTVLRYTVLNYRKLIEDIRKLIPASHA